MTAKKATAVPLLLIGGLLVVVLGIATVGAELYLSYKGIEQMIDGNVGAGLGTIFVTTTAVGLVLSLLSLPAGGLMALGDALWNSGTTDNEID
jgi:hypothetical protein